MIKLSLMTLVLTFSNAFAETPDLDGTYKIDQLSCLSGAEVEPEAVEMSKAVSVSWIRGGLTIAHQLGTCELKFRGTYTTQNGRLNYSELRGSAGPGCGSDITLDPVPPSSSSFKVDGDLLEITNDPNEIESDGQCPQGDQSVTKFRKIL